MQVTSLNKSKEERWIVEQLKERFNMKYLLILGYCCVTSEFNREPP
jgi:hypothetical protein